MASTRGKCWFVVDTVLVILWLQKKLLWTVWVRESRTSYLLRLQKLGANASESRANPGCSLCAGAPGKPSVRFWRTYVIVGFDCPPYLPFQTMPQVYSFWGVTLPTWYVILEWGKIQATSFSTTLEQIAKPPKNLTWARLLSHIDSNTDAPRGKKWWNLLISKSFGWRNQLIPDVSVPKVFL